MNKVIAGLIGVLQIHTESLGASRGRLSDGMVAVISSGKGKTVTCTSGRLWITQEGDPADYVLEPDESLVLSGAGRTVVGGIDEAAYRVA